MINMMNMMSKIKEAQDRIKEAQKNLGDIKVTGESGGGMVAATVNGNKIIVDLDIDVNILKAEDKVLVQDLVIAATNKALQEVEVPAKEMLRKSTEGIIPNVPGVDFTGLMG